mmetsp:Transcript_35198/g.69086  ORF Transcript_35198/g.69086 Transcript_35198/m.69086 type:complete len:207 (-) Transcript_35198:446-1066(-)
MVSRMFNLMFTSPTTPRTSTSHLNSHFKSELVSQSLRPSKTTPTAHLFMAPQLRLLVTALFLDSKDSQGSLERTIHTLPVLHLPKSCLQAQTIRSQGEIALTCPHIACLHTQFRTLLLHRFAQVHLMEGRACRACRWVGHIRTSDHLLEDRACRWVGRIRASDRAMALDLFLVVDQVDQVTRCAHPSTRLGQVGLACDLTWVRTAT